MITAPSPELIARARAGLDLKPRDPLSYWHFAVPRLRDAFALFADPDPIDELHGRACNVGTKTESFAAYALACLQKRPTLDGVPIPRWKGRVEAVQLVLDYKQQLLSVQPAYERLLGRWPKHVHKTGTVWESISVMPFGGRPDSQSGWSIIHFLSQKNLTSGIGVRADVVMFDEPPNISILRELRKAPHAGRQMVLGIGETPTIRRQWAELARDYGDTPRRTLRRVDQERAECRWSMDEVADWVLSPEEKAKLLRKYLGADMDLSHPRDPLALARIHGDYCNTEGSCPFHIPTLEAMLAECVDPLETFGWPISQEGIERETGGRPKVTRHVPVEVWRRPRPAESYLITIDPSSGVDDSDHDPYDLQVTEIGTGDLVLEAGGYLPGYVVGLLAAGIARQYNNAAIDPEVNDRWGVNVVEGVHAARYGHFARERRELKPGEWADEIGFHNTQKSRPIIIGSIQTWVDAWQAGVRYAKCPSRKVIETLLDCILDQDGKVVGAPGVHDERLIVRGQALRRTVKRRGMDIPYGDPPVLSKAEKLIQKVMGTQDAFEPPGGGRAVRERPRV